MSMVFLKLHSSFLMLGVGGLILKSNLIFPLRYVFIIFLVLFSTGSFATIYYVSSSGDDSSAGTSPTDAWRTLDKVNSFSARPGDQVLFKRGDQWVGTLTVRASGTSGSPVVYGAYGTGEKPKIYNSEVVSGWSVYSGNIYKANFIASKVEQVFLDGTRLVSARYPNKGYFEITTVKGSNKFTSAQIDGSINYSGATAVIRDKEWSISTKAVTESFARVLTLSSAPMYGLGTKKGFVLVDKLEFLDEAGEWYYDDVRNVLYVWIPGNDSPNNHTIRASVRDYAVFIDNKDYITIRDLNLLHSNDDAIYVNKSAYITIDNNHITLPDNRGMTVNSGSSNHISFTNNYVDGANHDGVKIEGTYHNFSDNTIKNIRLFKNFGVGGLGDPMGGRGLSVRGGYCTIRYNHIEDIGYNGIGFFSAPHTTIEHNYIKNTCLTTQDGGGIYCYNTSESDPGCEYSEIRGNIVENVPGNTDGCTGTVRQGCGIYMDDRIHHIVIEGNTVTGASYYGVYLHNNKNVVARGNTLFDNGNAYRATGSFGAGQNSIHGNIILNTSASGSGAKATLGVLKSTESAIVGIDNNKYIDKHRGAPFADTKDYSYKTFRQWQSATGQDRNSTFDGAPLGEGETEQLLYNNTKQAKTINLGNSVYKDIDGNDVSGTVTLQPFTSKILIGANIGAGAGANRAPVLNGQLFEINGGAPAGGFVGMVVGNDPDAGQSLVYSVTGGGGAGLFYIDAATGGIFAKTDIAATENQSVALVVTVRDNAANPLSATATMSINIVAAAVGGKSPDTAAPSILSFSVPGTSDSLGVPVLAFEATDNNAVAGYLITESGTPPLAGDGAWAASPPGSYTFSSAGAHTLYAWAKDGQGNVSGPLTAGVTIVLPGNSMFSEYLFEEGTGAVVLDSEGPNDGAIVNGGTRCSGVTGGGLQLSGVGYVDLGGCFNDVGDQLTLSAWVKPDATASGYQGVVMHGGPLDDTYAVYIHRDYGRVAFKTTGTKASPWLAADNAGSLWDGNWHNITVTYDGREKLIYLDNEVIAKAADSGPVAPGGGHNLLVGAGRDTSPATLLYKGSVDEVRVYGYALTPGQVSDIFNRAWGGAAPAPVYATEVVSICQGDNYLGWAGTGTYQRVLAASSGADSIVTTELTVHPSYFITEEVTVAEGGGYLGWTESGEYRQLLTSSTGCDSIVTIILSVETNRKINIDALELSHSESTPFKQTNTGYELSPQAKNHSLGEDSESIEFNLESNFIIYPNPTTNSYVNIDFTALQDKKATIEIIDINGRIVVNRLVATTSNRIDLNHLSPGLYYIVSRVSQEVNTKKLLVR